MLIYQNGEIGVKEPFVFAFWWHSHTIMLHFLNNEWAVWEAKWKFQPSNTWNILYYPASSCSLRVCSVLPSWSKLVPQGTPWLHPVFCHPGSLLSLFHWTTIDDRLTCVNWSSSPPLGSSLLLWHPQLSLASTMFQTGTHLFVVWRITIILYIPPSVPSSFLVLSCWSSTAAYSKDLGAGKRLGKPSWRVAFIWAIGRYTVHHLSLRRARRQRNSTPVPAPIALYPGITRTMAFKLYPIHTSNMNQMENSVRSQPKSMAGKGKPWRCFQLWLVSIKH